MNRYYKWSFIDIREDNKTIHVETFTHKLGRKFVAEILKATQSYKQREIKTWDDMLALEDKTLNEIMLGTNIFYGKGKRIVFFPKEWLPHINDKKKR